MSMVLRTRLKDYDLGPTLEFLKFEQEVSKLSVKAKKEFPTLFGIVDMNDEIQSRDVLKSLSIEADEALKQFKDSLSVHAKWILEMLAGIGGKR
jgi:hypothetical protein